MSKVGGLTKHKIRWEDREKIKNYLIADADVFIFFYFVTGTIL